MSKSWIVIAGASLLGSVASVALAGGDDAHSHCSMATLHGTYAFAGVGQVNGLPYSTSGVESYDGQGHIKYTQLWKELQPPPNPPYTATFNGFGTILSISADCIAKVVYDGNLENVWTFFVAPDGSRNYYNNMDPASGIISGGHEERISAALFVE